MSNILHVYEGETINGVKIVKINYSYDTAEVIDEDGDERKLTRRELEKLLGYGYPTVISFARYFRDERHTDTKFDTIEDLWNWAYVTPNNADYVEDEEKWNDYLAEFDKIKKDVEDAIQIGDEKYAVERINDLMELEQSDHRFEIMG